MDQSSTPAEHALPLTGIRVVALEQAVAAPFCSRQLADMGAVVVKIERPEVGDFARSYDDALNGVSAYFAWLNRGKRSLELDIKSETGRDVLGRLLERADVFVHNLTPGAVERLGFGYDDVKDRYPRLIWLGISGYGPDGPYRDKKAYDMLIQAESGVVSLTGTQEHMAKVGISIADIAAGLYGYASILTALLNRAKTGRGERIDISLFECMTEWMMAPMNVFLGTGKAPDRAGLRHNMIVPYGAYHCADGAVLFAVQSQQEWKRFCDVVLEQPALTDDVRFATNNLRLENRDALEALIEAKLGGHTVAVIVERLDRADIANAKVNDLPAVAEHPQLTARRRWAEVSSFAGKISALIPPHNLATVSPFMGSIPELGEHSHEILVDLGLEDTI